MADSAADGTADSRGEVAAAEIKPNFPSFGSPHVNTRLKNGVRGGARGRWNNSSHPSSVRATEKKLRQSITRHADNEGKMAGRVQPAALDARKHSLSAAGLAKWHG